jgi:exodeoxyribonuclease III
MRIVTWNINSVRLRLDLIAELVRQVNPDVLCLQEIKVVNELFPAAELAEMGFTHQAVAGMKSYNGVAILSRLPITESTVTNWCDKEDCRHIQAVIEGIRVHNFYVPAGGDIPDPEENVKFAHKLRFLDEVTEWFSGQQDHPALLVGDLNIAPLETDVWSHKQLLKVVSHTPIEVEKMAAWQQSLNWVDGVRKFIPPEIKLYSWWSYRSPDWDAGDRGRRLDHIWATPSLTHRLTGAMILREARHWAPPSDHVPVMVDLV